MVNGLSMGQDRGINVPLHARSASLRRPIRIKHLAVQKDYGSCQKSRDPLFYVPGRFWYGARDIRILDRYVAARHVTNQLDGVYC